MVKARSRTHDRVTSSTLTTDNVHHQKRIVNDLNLDYVPNLTPQAIAQSPVSSD